MCHKKIGCPVRELKAREKTELVDLIRADQANLPKAQRFKVGDLLEAVDLIPPTYYDERRRIANPNDKYADGKELILQIVDEGRVRGEVTYGYRRVQTRLEQEGVHLAGATVMKLMKELGVQAEQYNRKRHGKYSSYKGTVGTVAENVLEQEFDADQPYQVVHTDVTQVRLANQQWAYISAMTDEASKEVLAFQVSAHPDRQLIMRTLDELLTNLPDSAHPIIHPDQGWHYQLSYYTQKLQDHQFIQSMSRKGNCLDNAPIESFFHLYKTELLHGFPPCRNLDELRKLSLSYVKFFNNVRISLKTKGMTPVQYRNHALVA